MVLLVVNIFLDETFQSYFDAPMRVRFSLHSAGLLTRIMKLVLFYCICTNLLSISYSQKEFTSDKSMLLDLLHSVDVKRRGWHYHSGLHLS